MAYISQRTIAGFRLAFVCLEGRGNYLVNAFRSKCREICWERAKAGLQLLRYRPSNYAPEPCHGGKRQNETSPSSAGNGRCFQTVMSLVRALAVRAGWLEHRRVRRLTAEELNASYVAGSKRKRVRVKDISSGGLYLFTRDRWMPGTCIELTLRKRSLFEHQPPDSIRLRAKSVRLGADGVGLVFEPDHIAADIWMSLFVKATGAVRQKDTVRVLRIAKALAFLRRTSPAAESAVLEHIAGESIFESGERAVETILNAEELVESWNFAIRTGVAPSLIVSILENASRTNSELIRQRWSGLLASSIQYWARDRESAQFISLLCLLDPIHSRILDSACSRALRAGREAGRNLAYSKQAMRNVAGVSDFLLIEQHLDRLSFLGLLEPAIRCEWFGEIDQIELTPTQVGLRFYARCRGLLDPPGEALQMQNGSVLPFQAGNDDWNFAPRESPRMYAPAS